MNSDPISAADPTCPCAYCGRATRRTATKRCDGCYELDGALSGNSVEVIVKSLLGLHPEFRVGFCTDSSCGTVNHSPPDRISLKCPNCNCQTFVEGVMLPA